MPREPRVIPIPCKFAGGGIVYTYFIDAPQPTLIDTGVAGSPHTDIEQSLAAAGVKLSDIRWILATHGHWDHIGGARALKDAANPDAQFAIHADDLPYLRGKQAHMDGYYAAKWRFVDSPADLAASEALLLENLSGEIGADRALADGDRVSLGGDITINVVHTPGHSAGSVSYLIDGLNWGFTGDSIQGGGSARSRFPVVEFPDRYRSSLQMLQDSVRPTRLYMGHTFLGPDGELWEAQALTEADAQRTLAGSLSIEQRVRDAAALIDSSTTVQPWEQFKPAAATLGLNPDDPMSWSNYFFLIMEGHLHA